MADVRAADPDEEWLAPRVGSIDPPGWDEAWERYRRHFPYGYFLWAITQISSREVVLVHIPRIATAMEDHGTLKLLGVL